MEISEQKKRRWIWKVNILNKKILTKSGWKIFQQFQKYKFWTTTIIYCIVLTFYQKYEKVISIAIQKTLKMDTLKGMLNIPKNWIFISVGKFIKG